MNDIVKKAALILKSGGTVAFPTETVYGLGADARNHKAVERIYDIKGRPKGHPLIVHIASFDKVKEWACDISPFAKILADAFWPGPLTLILKKSPTVSMSVTGRQQTVGLRVPSNPIALELLRYFNGGIAAPSANSFGKISPTTAQHVQHDLGSRVDMIIDGGRCMQGIESTIVDLSGTAPRLLRPGALSSDVINNVLKKFGIELSIMSPANKNIPQASGMLLAHYAPRASLFFIESSALIDAIKFYHSKNYKIIVLARSKQDINRDNVTWICMPISASDYAYELYAQMHCADMFNPHVIIVEKPPLENDWIAVHDRLTKAEHGSAKIE